MLCLQRTAPKSHLLKTVNNSCPLELIGQFKEIWALKYSLLFLVFQQSFLRDKKIGFHNIWSLYIRSECQPLASQRKADSPRMALEAMIPPHFEKEYSKLPDLLWEEPKPSLLSVTILGLMQQGVCDRFISSSSLGSLLVAVRRRSTNPFSQLPLWQANPWEQLFPTHSLPDSYPSADSPVRPVAASPKAQASTAIWAGERQDARAPARFTTLIML
jgi:hypothetical protein